MGKAVKLRHLRRAFNKQMEPPDKLIVEKRDEKEPTEFPS
jgi:hypothetical protein